MVSLCASAQIVDAQNVSPRPGEQIRVWLKNPQAHFPEFRLLMPKTKHFEAEFVWMTDTRIAFDANSPALRIAHIPIGRMRGMETLALAEVERLEVLRTTPFQRPGRKKITRALVAGIGSGLLVYTAEQDCGGEPCSKASRIGGTLGAGTLVAALVILYGSTERWEPMPLPSAPDAEAH